MMVIQTGAAKTRTPTRGEGGRNMERGNIRRRVGLCGNAGKVKGGRQQRALSVRRYAAQEMSDMEKLQATFNTPLEDDLYVPLGRANCFTMSSSGGGKLNERFIIEPIPAAGLEAMSKGMTTSYTVVYGATLGQALAKDMSKLPNEFADAEFGTNFKARCEFAARTWDRNFAREMLMDIVPSGEVRSDFNFDIDGDNKRVLNAEHVVDDSDNIKQDMSIDVYGRGSKEDESGQSEADIAELYNV